MYEIGKRRTREELAGELKLESYNIHQSPRLGAEIAASLSGCGWASGGIGGPILMSGGQTSKAPNPLMSVDDAIALTSTMGFGPGDLTKLMGKTVLLLADWTTREKNPLNEREAFPVVMTYLLLTDGKPS